jgi:hypothetical protein
MAPHPDALSQAALIQSAIDDGRGIKLFEEMLKESTHDDHFSVVGSCYFAARTADFGNEWLYNSANGILLYLKIAESDKVITYTKKEVGSLIRFDGGAPDSEGMILADYLETEASKMSLNDAQIVELEYLLNKVGKTLGITIPSVPLPTEEDMRVVLFELALEAMKAKPKHFHQKFLDRMLAKGAPASINYKDFQKYLAQELTP